MTAGIPLVPDCALTVLFYPETMTGTWGLVYLCTRIEDNRSVAIKRIKQSPNVKEGANFTAIREVKYLRELKHDNIIEVIP